MSDKREYYFWMVYGDGRGAPTVQHHNLALAKAEATRLAREHPNVDFFVLQAIGVARRTDVVYEEIDKIPF